MSHTHADLCSVAVRWLKRPNSANGHGCLFAISEGRAETTGECPDAIGFRAGWNDGSVLVECKATRSDFLADKTKPHRKPDAGMGTWRYFMAPAGLIRVDELPPKWGLLEVNARGHVKPMAGPAAAAGAGYGAFNAALEAYRHQTTDVARERALLVRLLVRVGDVEALNLRIREAMAAQNRMVKRIEDLRRELSDENNHRWLTRIERDRLADELDHYRWMEATHG